MSSNGYCWRIRPGPAMPPIRRCTDIRQFARKCGQHKVAGLPIKSKRGEWEVNPSASALHHFHSIDGGLLLLCGDLVKIARCGRVATAAGGPCSRYDPPRGGPEGTMRNSTTRFVLAAVLGLAVGAAGRAEAGLLVNGSFQTGTLADWTSFNTANGTAGTGFPVRVIRHRRDGPDQLGEIQRGRGRLHPSF